MPDGVDEALVPWDSLAAAYGLDLAAAKIDSLGSAGGLSKSRFWYVAAPDATPLCVRRRAPGTMDAERLGWIHSVIQQVAAQGCDFVPVPLTTRDRGSYWEHAGHLWEVAPWLAGEADDRPGAARVAAAMRALAQFHNAALAFGSQLTLTTTTPGIKRRIERLASLRVGRCAAIAQAVGRRADSPLAAHAPVLIEAWERAHAGLTSALVATSQAMLRLQLCVLDVKAEHFLYVGDAVRGLIDLDGLSPDLVACDVARLLGSFVGDDAERFDAGVAAYAAVHPLSEYEQSLVRVLDRANVVLSGIQWLDWIFLEERVFDDWGLVRQLLDKVAIRAAHLLEAGGSRLG